MTAPPAKPCDEMTTQDFMNSWVDFLSELKGYGETKIETIEPPTLVSNGLKAMWEEGFELIMEYTGEVEELVDAMGGDGTICRIIWAIAAWDPYEPLGGVGSSGMWGATGGKTIKDAVETWLGSSGAMSTELESAFKTLNQLLCMMNCI